jgi:GTP-binding nuclear protein Ran
MLLKKRLTHHKYYDLSARSSYNLEKPFLWLARRLTNQGDLQFVGQFAKAPKIRTDTALIARHEQELQEAQNVAIGDDGPGLGGKGPLASGQKSL